MNFIIEKSLIRYMFCKYLLQISGVFLTFLIVLFGIYKFLILIKSNLSVFSLVALPSSRSTKIHSMFTSESKVRVHLHSFACSYSATPVPFFFSKIILSSLDGLAKNQLTIDVGVYFWTPNSIPSMFMSSLRQHHTVLITVAFY